AALGVDRQPGQRDAREAETENYRNLGVVAELLRNHGTVGGFALVIHAVESEIATQHPATRIDLLDREVDALAHLKAVAGEVTRQSGGVPDGDGTLRVSPVARAIRASGGARAQREHRDPRDGRQLG